MTLLRDAKAFSSFSAPDLEAIKKFYTETLGCDVKETPMGLELYLEGITTPIFIYKSKDYNPPEHTVINFVVEDIDAAVADLSERGVTMEQYDMPGMKTDERGIVRFKPRVDRSPTAIAWFKDPADHILAVIEDKKMASAVV